MGLRYQTHKLYLTVVQMDKFEPPCLQSKYCQLKRSSRYLLDIYNPFHFIIHV